MSDPASNLPLTTADYTAVVTWAADARAQCMKAEVVDVPDDSLERVYVWEPRRHLQDDPRWSIWRDAAGLWMEDYATDTVCGPTTMADVLATVTAINEAETAELIAAIPRLALPAV